MTALEKAYKFDAAWYLAAYPDVAAAVQGGGLASAASHFTEYGADEGRFPSAQAEKDHRLGRGLFDPAALASISDEERQRRVGRYWSGQQGAGWMWLAHPMVRARLNTLASGRPDQDAYDRLVEILRERGQSIPVPRAVSLGCGFGNLERDLARRGIIREIEAYDIAPTAIEEARRLAAEAGMDGLHYHLADLERAAFPAGQADVVFAHASVHHIERLEALFDTVERMLKPGGLFHIWEYVGPTRFQWTDAQMALTNDFLGSLPERLRRMPSGRERPLQTRPTIATMIDVDPSEAIRSADIVKLMRERFEIIEERPLGGTLLHLGLAEIAQNFDADRSPADRQALEDFFAAEDAAMRDGRIGSDHVVITAARRSPVQESHKPMSQSLSTRLSLLFPPAQRLHAAINELSVQTKSLSADQARLRAEVAALETRLRTAPQPETRPQATPAPVENTAETDFWTAREMQSAAQRNLPFLPGHIERTETGLAFQGYAGAPDGLTGNMAFFVNGKRFDQVEYPLLDEELASRFPTVRGMGNCVRARMTQHLDELDAAPFWRFDASSTGVFVSGAWRRAVHFKNPAFERFPLPPVPNIKRVIGDDDQVRFAMGGAFIFRNVEALLGELGHSWQDFPRILDWGCGAGRLTRYLLDAGGCQVTGADIDADNVAWCRENLHGGRFEVLSLHPPTGFADGEFDLVTGISVVTHLAEADQFAWLDELRRITRPGALVLLSIQGPTQFAYNRFPPPLWRRIQQEGFLDLARDPALDGYIGAHEYYRSVMQSRSYVVDKWSRYFEVLAIEDAIAGLQDFVVMRRGP